MASVNSSLELLLGAREEQFCHERCIRFFQLQTWVWFPEKGMPGHAGRLAAAAILRKMEEQYTWSNQQAVGGAEQVSLAKFRAVSRADDYRGIYDEMVSRGGGWSGAVLTTPAPKQFDVEVKRRAKIADYVADLIEYRMRAALNPPAGQDRSLITHAVYFKCRKRRKPCSKTLFSWWGHLHRTAAFIYLAKKRGLPLIPPPANDGAFFQKLMDAPNSSLQLKRLFGEYQFVYDTLADDEFYDLPEIVKPIRFDLDPFSDEELSIIGDYDEQRDGISDPRRGLGLRESAEF